MQNSKPELSIIIVNYRSEQYLKNCVASLFKHVKDINFEIIVVNNDEQTRLKEVKEKFPDIIVINQQKNIGFGAANNLGAQNAQGEQLLFLNPDTEIISAGLQKAIKKFTENKKVAVIGPRLLTEKGETQPWCAGKENTIWRIVKNNLGFIDSKAIWESQEEIFADWVSGGAMFARAEVFKAAGGFDEAFFMYFEDNDLCKRIRNAGYEILYMPDLAIKHFCGKSAAGKISQKKQFYLSGARYFWKHREKK